MLMFAITFALTGAALGLMFKAPVLVPTSGFALVSPILTNFADNYLAANAGAGNDYDSRGASDWVPIE